MTYQVLARKWRPKKFEEVVGQAPVTVALQKSLMNERIAHAYLFSGTRGVGKTSVARLFARALRCENRSKDGNSCYQCKSCLEISQDSSMDVIEIDGASNNGVDHVRSLVENVQYLPASGKYKVYIIDEVHMLSQSAFNALLKTLEEPPAHVLFIFATTEPEKLLSTVLSRCQRFDFRSVSLDDLVQHLKNICSKEKIQCADDILFYQLARQGKGSVRDTLSLLDQVLNYCDNNKITEDALVMALGLARTSAIRNLLLQMLMQNTTEVSQTYRQILKENGDVKSLCLSFLDHLFYVIENLDTPQKLLQQGDIQEGILKEISTAEFFWIFEAFSKDVDWALKSIDPEKVVEILLQKLCLRRTLLSQPVSVPEATAKKKIDFSSDWDAFLAFLTEQSATLAANLEQGNILEVSDLSQNPLTIQLGFTKEAQIFFEYLKEKTVQQKLLTYLAQYFKKPESYFKVEWVLLTEQQKKALHFKSKIESDTEEKARQIEEKKQKLMDDPAIKEVAKIFDAKVGKVTLSS